jgi:predicted 3-demethylubiquinone-9 3-methyltransferase (glyoxalase superfamily)
MAASHNITPCQWFEGEAEEAARFYVSVFRPGSAGSAVTARKASKYMGVPQAR